VRLARRFLPDLVTLHRPSGLPSFGAALRLDTLSQGLHQVDDIRGLALHWNLDLLASPCPARATLKLHADWSNAPRG